MYNIVQRVHKLKWNSVFLFPSGSAVFISSEKLSACALSVTTWPGGRDVLGLNFTCAIFSFSFNIFFSTNHYIKMP